MCVGQSRADRALLVTTGAARQFDAAQPVTKATASQLPTRGFQDLFSRLDVAGYQNSKSEDRALVDLNPVKPAGSASAQIKAPPKDGKTAEPGTNMHASCVAEDAAEDALGPLRGPLRGETLLRLELVHARAQIVALRKALKMAQASTTPAFGLLAGIGPKEVFYAEDMPKPQQARSAVAAPAVPAIESKPASDDVETNTEDSEDHNAFSEVTMLESVLSAMSKHRALGTFA